MLLEDLGALAARLLPSLGRMGSYMFKKTKSSSIVGAGCGQLWSARRIEGNSMQVVWTESATAPVMLVLCMPTACIL